MQQTSLHVYKLKSSVLQHTHTHTHTHTHILSWATTRQQELKHCQRCWTSTSASRVSMSTQPLSLVNCPAAEHHRLTFSQLRKNMTKQQKMTRWSSRLWEQQRLSRKIKLFFAQQQHRLHRGIPDTVFVLVRLCGHWESTTNIDNFKHAFIFFKSYISLSIASFTSGTLFHTVAPTNSWGGGGGGLTRETTPIPRVKSMWNNAAITPQNSELNNF